MKFGSLFSGIEAASVAWQPLGWSCAWVAEIDPFACALLKHRYPGIRNLGDVNAIDPAAVEPVDLIVFGSPCQSFSVAGKRLGLDDPRGNMALVGLRVVGRIRPRWVVWENVPGVLSSDGGRDFGAFLGLLGKLGYGFAYRVLDAQHFGVPQRRRRLFVVGYLGDWRPAAAVLFEQQSLQRHSAPSRQTGQNAPAGAGDGSAYSHDGSDHGDVTPTLRAGTHDKSHANAGVMPAIAFDWRASAPQSMNPSEVAPSLSVGRADGTATITHALDSASAGHATEDGTGRGVPLVVHSLRADGFDAGEDGKPYNIIGGAQKSRNHAYATEVSGCLQHKGLAASGNEAGTLIGGGTSVRRLTPRECERLQGFPDDYTLIPHRGKPAADGPRYRAIGNSMAVPVMRWIGHRIQLFEESAKASLPGEAAA